MPLFACDNCGCIENTALCRFWGRNIEKDLKGRALCSECDSGKWHGRFPKEKWDGKRELYYPKVEE